jgi:hypothetical protein
VTNRNAKEFVGAVFESMINYKGVVIMQKLGSALLAVAVTLFIAASASAASTTVTGTVTDTMCGKKHMIAGKTDADCTRECMKSKGNWTYGLAVGDQVYALSGDNQKFGNLAGKKVIVTGQQSGNTITVQSISQAQ